MASSKKREGEAGAAPATKKAKSFSLDEALSEVDHTVDELASAGKGPMKYDGSQVVDKLMQEITKIAARIPLSQLEVEIRVGVITNAGFRPGVHQEDFDVILALLSKENTATITEEIDFVYPDSRGRVTWDAGLTRVVRAVSKIPHANFDTGTNLPYDLRASLAQEQVIPYASQSVEEGFQTKRHKTRLSFRFDLWKAELTTVVAEGQTGSSTTYEVEFELHPSSIPNHTNKAKMHDILSRLVAEPRNLIAALDAPTERNFPEIILDKVTNAEELSQLRDLCMAAFPSDEKYSAQSFPGSMPVNFSRKHFRMVQNEDYFVSEKTDGLRYLLMVTQDAPYFIDRKFDFFMIQGFGMLMEIYGGNGITVLDGEMVRNLTTKKPMFMLFDALQFNGEESVCMQKLSDRFKVISVAVESYRKALSEKKIVENTLPFSIIGKRFFPKVQINTLFNDIRTTQEGHEYKDASKRHHFTDGLIFTPNIEYQAYTSHRILKWKYLEKLTVDFKLRMKNQKRYLTCAGTNDSEVDCRETNFSENDNKRLYKDIMRARDQQNVIIECGFDTISGTWKYFGLRADKHKANFIQTVFDTMENIAENITTEEIRYRVAVQTKYDDWEVKMKTARDGVLTKLIPGQHPSSNNNNNHNQPRPHHPPSSHHPPQSSHPHHPPPASHPHHPASHHPPPSKPPSTANPHHTSHPAPPPPKRVPVPPPPTQNSNNKPMSVNQLITTYEFGDEDEDAYEEGDNEYEDERSNGNDSRKGESPNNNYKPNGHAPSNGHYLPPPAPKREEYDDDELTSGGEDWQRSDEQVYDHGEDNGEDRGDDDE